MSWVTSRTLVSSAMAGMGKIKSPQIPQFTGISINRSIIRRAHKRIFTFHFVVWPQLEYSVWVGVPHLSRKQPPLGPLENKNDLENTFSEESLKELGLCSLGKRWLRESMKAIFKYRKYSSKLERNNCSPCPLPVGQKWQALIVSREM